MAANQVSEQEIQFRKRARRRLVGAVALVLLMVTVLPMVLDDREVKTPQPDIAISIPSQEGGDFSSKIVPVAPQAENTKPQSPQVQLASPLEPKPVATPSPKVGSEVKPQAAEAASSEPKPSEPKLSEPKPIDSKAADTKPVAVKPASDDAPIKAAPSPAKPKPAAAEKSVAKKGGFTVQIGVFTETDKFKQLESKISAQGFHPSREKLDTPKGPKIRLRIGPFVSRTDAEQALGKLKSVDVPGMIVTNK